MSKVGFKQTEIGIAPEDWEVVPFAKLLSANIKHGLYRGQEYLDEKGVRILKMGVQTSNERIGNQKMERLRLSNSEIDRFKVEEGDLIFSRTSMMKDGAGVVNIVTSHSDPIVFDGNLLCASLKKQNVCPEFYYYFFKTNIAKQEILKISTGTQSRSITATSLAKVIVPLPNFEEQVIVAKALRVFDDAIDLNLRTIKTFEAICQSIFKRWFVDFEFPNQEGKSYKSSGGEIVDSEIGPIPNRWRTGQLNHIAELLMGQSPEGSTYNDSGEGMPLLNGAADFQGQVILPRKWTNNPIRVCKKGSIVFCIRATIGNAVFADREYCLGRGVAALNPKNGVFEEYIYFILQESFSELISKASGSVILGLSKADIDELPIMIPDNQTIERFSELCSVLFCKIVDQSKNNATLASIRDCLLPKLMSGSLRIPLTQETTEKKRYVQINC